MKSRLFLTVLLVCLLAPIGLAQRSTNTVVFGLDSDIKNFNIALGFDASWFPSTLYFERLVTMDYGPDFEVHPGLAREWEVSDDARIYTFHLAEGVTWHDGTPFTSADVKYTYEGILEHNGMAASIFERVREIRTPDAHTVEVELTEPFAPFLFQLAVYPRTPILPQHLYEGADWATNPHNMNPIGTGPYQFKSHKPGQSVTFVRYEDYWGEKPEIETIVFKVIPDINVAVAQLRSGEIHALNNPPPLNLERVIDADPNLEVDAPPGPMAYYLALNVTKPPFDNIDVRRALAYALDRDELAEKASFGVFEASKGTYVSSVEWAFNPDTSLPEYDPVRAGDLLDQAGYVMDGRQRFQMSLWVSRPTEIIAAEVIKEQLREIGIDVRIRQLEDGLFRQSLTDLEHDAYVYGNWWGPDPSEWEIYTATGGFWNQMGYSNARVDELFSLALQTTDRDKRAEYYFEIQEIMLEEMPRVSLFDSGPYSFAHRIELDGWFSHDPASFRMDFSNVHWVD